MSETPKSGGELFIVDNSDDTWKGLKYLQDWTEIASAFDIASGYLLCTNHLLRFFCRRPPRILPSGNATETHHDTTFSICEAPVRNHPSYGRD
jgi:hypothetical protein